MKDFSKNTPYITKLANLSDNRHQISPEQYIEHDVKKGLRDVNGDGIVAGLTEISYVKAKTVDSLGNKIPCEGELYYRGVNIYDIVSGFRKEDRHGFEEVVYLLLMGKLPTREELDEFKQELFDYRGLPKAFVRDIILKAPAKNLMNTLSRCVLAMYSYDDNPDDTSTANVMRQCIKLIAQFPLFAVYGYHSYGHYHKDKSLVIHYPKPEYDTAENILYMLREDGQFSKLEADVLDLALVLHAEHGGGNNSTFTTHVVSSSGTDTYSAIAAALGSLKGPKHGGANIKVVQMFDDMKENIDTTNPAEVKVYLSNLLDKQAFDKAGLIYGMGHAVYSYSDPRAEVLKKYVKALAEEKGMQEDYKLYQTVAQLAPEVIAEKRKIYKGVSANVDFYSGLVYKMLNLPYELYTPIFAIARLAGWSAHRIEELQNAGKIIRPAYVNVKEIVPYVAIDKRLKD